MADRVDYLDTILSDHPDALDLIETPDFQRWIESRPASDYVAIYGNRRGAGGDAMTVIAILGDYKRSKGLKVWTRQEIAALTAEEYEKLESEIDEAMTEGRIVSRSA